MTGESLDIKSAELEKLHSLFPGLFTEGKLDWEKLKATFGDAIHFSNERYVLNWAGKADAYKVLQTPTTATLKPCPEESINFDTSENIFIEGENLEVLKILQKSYFGKIKVICIDPPYNTGNDSFVYPDKFSERKEDYLKRVGDKNEEGFLMKEGLFRKNSKDSGHFHSNWLSMMYPRLFLARNLLKDDGVIFVHIDDNEVHNLRLLMNEIFGEENFVAQVIIETATDNNPSLISNEHEYLLVFAKFKGLHSSWKKDSDKAKSLKEKYDELRKLYNEPPLIQQKLREWLKQNKEEFAGIKHYDNVDERGVYHDADIANPKFGGYFYDVLHPITGKPCKIPEKGFRYPEDTMNTLIEEGNIIFGEDETTLIKPKKRLEDVRDVFRSVIYNDGRAASKRLTSLLGRDIFKFPKDEQLEKMFLDFTTGKDDIVLDFFGGSGTTAHAVLEKNKEDKGNRKFILVQLPEPCEENSEAYKAGYKTIAEISKERIRRSIRKIESEKKSQQDLFKQNNPTLPLGFRVFKISDSNFKIWNTQSKSTNELITQLDAFTDPVSPTSDNENMIYELLLKSGYTLTEEIIKKDGYYTIKNKGLIIVLEYITTDIIISALAENPFKIICLDRAFAGNDQLKTNTILQLKEARIDFKII